MKLGWVAGCLLLLCGSLTGPDADRFVTASFPDFGVRASAAGVEFTTSKGDRLNLGRPRVQIGASSWDARIEAPISNPDGFEYDHGIWTEKYVYAGKALEQLFVLKEPVRRDISVRVPFSSEYVAKVKGERAVQFSDAKGNPRLVYRDPVALDRAGNIQELTLSVEDNEIALHVPASYLEKAVFPVLVDPLISAMTWLSPSGGIWRSGGVHIAWNPLQQLYLVVWHQGTDTSWDAFDHNYLARSAIYMRTIKMDAVGETIFSPPTPPTPSVLVPVAPTPLPPPNTPPGPVAHSPRVAYNPTANEFLVVWSEGDWSAFVDNANNNPPDPTPDHGTMSDVYPPNSRIVGARVNIPNTVPYTPALVVFGPAPGVDRVDIKPADATGTTPAVFPDVAWDGIQYVITWQTLLDQTYGQFEDLGNGLQYDHRFWTKAQGWYRTAGPTLTLAPSPIQLSEAKERFFIKGPTNSPANIVDASIAANLDNELVYECVPTDPMPRVASLILPGPDHMLGTADDLPQTSLIVWSVTTLVFNQGKSRIRGRFLQAGAPNAQPVFDVFSPPVVIVQRAAVAAGASKRPDDAGTPLVNESLIDSGFLVTFLAVDNIVREGSRAVEFIGSIKARAVDVNGFAVGNTIDVANPVAGANRWFLAPSVSWNYEAMQYCLAWTETDVIYNPVTRGAAWFPSLGQLQDLNSPFGAVATTYPQSASASWGGTGVTSLVNPLGSDLATWHTMIVGQEDDFGANYYRLYKNLPTYQSGAWAAGGGAGGGGSGGNPIPPPTVGPAPAAPTSSGGEGNEGCGATGMEMVILMGIAAWFRRRR